MHCPLSFDRSPLRSPLHFDPLIFLQSNNDLGIFQGLNLTAQKKGRWTDVFKGFEKG